MHHTLPQQSPRIRTAFVLVLLVFSTYTPLSPASPASTPTPTILLQCESLIREGAYQQAIETLEELDPTTITMWEAYQERLLSEAYLWMGSTQEGDWDDPARKHRMRTLYDASLDHAKLATTYAPDDAKAWFARASALGSISTLVAPLQALGLLHEVKRYINRSIELDPTLSGPYNLLALFYSVLPGWPISFGNKEYGVNISRYAVQLAQMQCDPDAEFTYMITLETALLARNWDAAKRARAQQRYATQYENAESDFERALVVEGILELPHLSDSEEAAMIRERYDLPIAGASQKTKVE